MELVEIIFWTGLFVIFYAILGYGIILWLCTLLKKKQFKAPASLPVITLVIAAYKEAAFLSPKINNCFALDYPKDKIKILFAIDGDDEQSLNILRNYEQITFVHSTTRRGKMAAINEAMQNVKTPIVIFSDANTMLNADAVRQIVKHYENPLVGGVAGEKKVNNKQVITGSGEGLYWRYESLLKQLDDQFYTVVGAAGELFSMRTSLFQSQPNDTILDDFMLWAHICQSGYKVSYEANAYALENPSANLQEELKRRIRISAGAFQSIGRLWSLFNFFKHFKLSFQYFSRRILRWIFVPVFLPVCFISNALLIWHKADFAYTILFVLQIVFYCLAITGGLFSIMKKKPPIPFLIPFYFVFMNLSLWLGFFKFIARSQSVLWEKSNRIIIPR